MSSIAPNTALYIRNLNDKVKKEELRKQLYSLFTPYGKVISIVAMKGAKMKGQAFVVFRDLAGATTAMRSLDGEVFYEKAMHIEYAKTQSHATMKLENPDFVPPKLLKISKDQQAAGSSKVTVSHAQVDNDKKRGRDEEMADGEAAKRQKDDEDMEMDEEPSAAGPAPTTNPSNVANSTLRCENLPVEVTDDVLGVLFQQYPGFQSAHVSPVLGANKSKTANVRYEQVNQATTAKDALDGFKLKKGWLMKVTYA
ncbi:hypothetical protein FRB95_010156 [Tulasnella sp. JGI-2019a]|nr:hypothetical protein FRB95_010156 [Tulasnella sp. JGI-2019a]